MSTDAYKVVELFEKRVAEYTGAPYAVAVDNCTNALFLSLFYLQETFNIDGAFRTIAIPKRTYVSVPCSIIHAGFDVMFIDEEWKGIYQLKPFSVFDAAKRFTRGMFNTIRARVDATVWGNLYVCLSFHGRKILNIGEGGMILTNNKSAVRWFKQMRFSGRDEVPFSEQKDITEIGFKMNLTPEQAARGLVLMDFIKDVNPDQEEVYPDLSKFTAFKKGK